MDDRTNATFFAFFNEIGIIGQLSRALFEARLPDGLLTAHFSVVNHMVRLGDGRTPLELATAFQVPKTTMTHMIAVLERHGFIDIRPNPADGRSKCVFLTDTGRAFREDAMRLLAPDIDRMAQVIDGDTVAALLPELERIRRYLDENRPEGR